MSTKRGRPLQADPRGLAQWLTREGENLPPQQYLRELVQNGFDAGANKINLDAVDDHLRVTDDGVGMTPAELEHHMATIFDSGAGRTRNYGVGARLATVARNGDGVTWISKAAGTPLAQATVYRRRGGYEYQEETPDKNLVGFTHTGTSVILRGQKNNRHTGSDAVLSGAQTFLTQRYWEFPKGAKVEAYRGQKRPILAAKENVVRYATASGEVRLTESSVPATLHWYVLQPAKDRTGDAQGKAARGGVFVNHENELFPPFDKATTAMRFGLFGKTASARAVLVITPDEGTVSMDTTRVGLRRKSGRHLPWSVWATEFGHHMPDAIREMVQAARPSGNIDKIVAEQMPNWASLLTAQTRLVTDPTGTETGEDGERMGTKGRQGTTTGGEGEKESAVRPDLHEAGTNPARQQDVYRLPDCRFTPRSEWIFGSAMVAFAKESNTLQVVEDAAPMVSRIDRVTADRKVPRDWAEEAVQKAFSIEITTSVLSILNLRNLRGAARYTEERMNTLLEPHNLSGVMLGMHAIDQLIDNSLTAMLKNQEEEGEAA